MRKIYAWQDIQDDFKDSLLLGNGSSMAIDRKFGYASLLEVAIEQGFITDRTHEVFAYFNTVDFEHVLTMLLHTSHVNRALGIKEKITEPVYSETRDALIKAVRHVHPAHEDVASHLPQVAEFMGRFKTVLSLNYDLIVYWAMLFNADLDVKFKDCFVAGNFRYDWNDFRKPISRKKKVTLVFYPHGNLILASPLQSGEEKISVSRDFERLLGTIFDTWTDKQYIPLFVSEGLNEQKIRAISRSSYLSTVNESVLHNCGKSVAVYGCSLADNDDHILEGLSKGHIERIAVSVYMQASDYEEYCSMVSKKLKKFFRGKPMELKFFDSASSGCWIY